MATPEQASGRNADDMRKAQIASAYGLAAAITVLFNVVLAFVKEAYAPLNTFMAQLTGHHWITHGLADILVFLLLG